MTTSRLGLPTLAAAQAQKEMTHNEALALLDIAVQPVVAAVAPATIPTAPTPGQCWIVGPDATAGASGDWTGHEGALAAWTDGGWRFIAPFEGMAAWSIADGGTVRRVGGTWRTAARGEAIADASGGSVIDVQARATLAKVLGLLRAHGLLAP